MFGIINRAIEIALALFRDNVSLCEGLLEGHCVMFDNLTARLEAQENVKYSSGALDMMREKLSTL